MWEFLITRPLGFIMKLIYDLVTNYGLAIIIFTIIVKLILMPLTVRSQKAMRKTQKIQPILMELQQKYANDKEKLQQETMKLYRENNVSMTGGCLPMLIQFPILIGLYQVIQKPLTFIMNIDWNLEPVKNEILRLLNMFPSMFGNYNTVDLIKKGAQIQLSQAASQAGTAGTLLEGAGTSVHPWSMNFNFLGMDISQAPSKGLGALMSGDFSNIAVILLLLIPIFALLASVVSMKITQKQSGQNSQSNPTSGVMTWMMPIMSLFFTVTLPAGIGLYWIISSVVQVVQQVAVNYFLDKKGEEIVVKIPEKKHKHGKKRKK